QVARTLGLGQPQRLVRTQAAHFERLDRQLQVVDRAGRTREVEHAVQRAVDVDEFGHVVADELKALPADQVGDVLGASGHEVVHADDLVTLGEKALTQARAQEAGGAGDQYAHGDRIQQVEVSSSHGQGKGQACPGNGTGGAGGYPGLY